MLLGLEAKGPTSETTPYLDLIWIQTFSYFRRVIDLCIMSLWIFPASQVALSVQKISKAKGPKMGTLISDEKLSQKTWIIYWPKPNLIFTRSNLGFIKELVETSLRRFWPHIALMGKCTIFYNIHVNKNFILNLHF